MKDYKKILERTEFGDGHYAYRVKWVKDSTRLFFFSKTDVIYDIFTFDSIEAAKQYANLIVAPTDKSTYRYGNVYRIYTKYDEALKDIYAKYNEILKANGVYSESTKIDEKYFIAHIIDDNNDVSLEKPISKVIIEFEDINRFVYKVEYPAFDRTIYYYQDNVATNFFEHEYFAGVNAIREKHEHEDNENTAEDLCNKCEQYINDIQSKIFEYYQELNKAKKAEELKNMVVSVDDIPMENAAMITAEKTLEQLFDEMSDTDKTDQVIKDEIKRIHEYEKSLKKMLIK